jgi:hypothetical protein
VRLEDQRGKTDFELWPPEVAEEFRKNDLEVLRTGRALDVVEESPSPDGRRCYWWNFKFPIHDASGRKFVGGIGVDITQRKHMEAMLQRVHDELWLTISDKGRRFDVASLAETAGFGLLTIRERAELLGGRMKIKSAPGRGSIFFIAVPDLVAGHDASP